MAPIITPKKGLNRMRHILQRKSFRVTICCALEWIFYSHSSHTAPGQQRRKKHSGATNSSSIDLRALNSDVK